MTNQVVKIFFKPLDQGIILRKSPAWTNFNNKINAHARLRMPLIVLLFHFNFRTRSRFSSSRLLGTHTKN